MVDGRRARGDASRRSVLLVAADLASVEGLDQLTVGRIAKAASVSKSNLTTLFGTREQLQLATVAAARERFVETVLQPGRRFPRGTERVAHLLDGWIAYSRDRVFPGGCFFAAAAVDFDAKPGPVRDAVARALDEWEGYLAASVRLAHEQGELPGLDDPEQMSFEFTALLDHANRDSLLKDQHTPYMKARVAIGGRLRSAQAAPALIDAFLGVSDARRERLHAQTQLRRG